MASESVEFCVGCSLGGQSDPVAIIIAVFGALLSVAGFFVSLRAYLATGKNHDALILRGEFERHRTPIEAALIAVREKHSTLSTSNNPALPWARIEQNFLAEQAAVDKAVLAILLEAKDVDERRLFKEKWSPALQKMATQMEQYWDVISDGGASEMARRGSAYQIIAALEGYRAAVRSLLEHGVRAPLARRKFW